MGASLKPTYPAQVVDELLVLGHELLPELDGAAELPLRAAGLPRHPPLHLAPHAPPLGRHRPPPRAVGSRSRPRRQQPRGRRSGAGGRGHRLAPRGEAPGAVPPQNHTRARVIRDREGWGESRCCCSGGEREEGGTHLRRSDGEAARRRLRRTHMAGWAPPVRHRRSWELFWKAPPRRGGGEVGLGGGGAINPGLVVGTAGVRWAVPVRAGEAGA